MLSFYAYKGQSTAEPYTTVICLPFDKRLHQSFIFFFCKRSKFCDGRIYIVILNVLYIYQVFRDICIQRNCVIRESFHILAKSRDRLTNFRSNFRTIQNRIILSRNLARVLQAFLSSKFKTDFEYTFLAFNFIKNQKMFIKNMS